jgi:hypothetical protein
LKDKQKEHLAHRWSTCPVSHKPLVKPIVSDCSGDLYNKDAILQYLLPAEASSIDKDEYEKFIQGRIKGLKDVVEVQFEKEQGENGRPDRWVCPVMSKELGPNVKAVYLVPCGHAFSQEAIKEMKSDGKCIQCATAYEERDIIPILPSSEKDKALVIERIETLRSLGLTHSLKKASGNKKRKANGDVKADVSADVPKAKDKISNDDSKAEASNGAHSSDPETGIPGSKLSNGIKNTATASLTARVLEEEEARKKRRRENDNLSSLYTKKSEGKDKKNTNFMTRGFSIPANGRP